MMMNLFSSFSPSTITPWQINWLSTTLPVFFISTSMWLSPPRFNFPMLMVLKLIFTELSSLLKPLQRKTLIIFLSLFFLIMINNIMGLIPYIFTASSHLTFTLSLSLSLWLGYMLFGFSSNLNHMLTHLTPAGTPAPLIPLMVIIESISSLIRPGTLAVRLTANMIAGHLLMTLMSNNIPSMSYSSSVVMLFTQILLIMLELAVALIQSYVFSVLSVLYMSEVVYDKI